jgi:putative Ca2+/H+ antiporter (TMEM165/GDT1 family)
MLAPFPWQIGKMSQALIMPETLVWWCLLPVMVSGLLYSIRFRLRPAIPILVFSTMLTLAYSIFQGNIGMAYRQRTQIQVFLFMFIAVGIVMIMEKRENKKEQLRASHITTRERGRRISEGIAA